MTTSKVNVNFSRENKQMMQCNVSNEKCRPSELRLLQPTLNHLATTVEHEINNLPTGTHSIDQENGNQYSILSCANNSASLC